MKQDIKVILGMNVKKLRKSKGLSQAALAQEISVRTQAVCQIENGRSYPAPDTISKICDEFSVSPARLFSCAKKLSQTDNSNRASLLETVNIILSEMSNDKLEVLISIMATLAEDSVKIEIQK